MEVLVEIKSRNTRAHAQAIFIGESIIVKAGGVISEDFAAHIKSGKTARTMRNDRSCVSEDGKIIKDCIFASPSTAAQFVTGRSINGYDAWKVEKKKSLGMYLNENGLR